MAPSSQTPVVLVTGTSSGIGLHTAVAAAGAGWTVVATLRDLCRADALRTAADEAGVELDVRALDVTDEAAVRRLVDEVAEQHGRLDAVVNNAGAGLVGTVEQLGLASFRQAMEVNFFGVVAVTEAAMPHLRASRGVLLTITSVGGVVGQPFNEAYCAAKFATEGFLQSLHPVAAVVGVRVVAVEPAAVASSFVANTGVDLETTPGGDGPYAAPWAAYVERTRTAFAAAQPPHEVAALVVDLIGQDAPPARVQTSPGAQAFVSLSLADVDGSRVTGATRGWLAPTS